MYSCARSPVHVMPVLSARKTQRATRMGAVDREASRPTLPLGAVGTGYVQKVVALANRLLALTIGLVQTVEDFEIELASMRSIS